MSSPDYTRSKILNTIPSKKISNMLESLSDDENKSIKSIAINRYSESNIPIEYWSLKMDKDFLGDQNLLKIYNEYIEDINLSYTSGLSICFAGGHGRGKTMTTACILKKALHKGFTALYTTLGDVVSALISQSDEKAAARRELLMVDFLVIDEFDSRFFGSDNAADLYARSLESIFRTRIQNRLPTLMCTNSPNIVESLNGPLKQSIESLMNKMRVVPVFGDDFRKKK